MRPPDHREPKCPHCGQPAPPDRYFGYCRECYQQVPVKDLTPVEKGGEK